MNRNHGNYYHMTIAEMRTLLLTRWETAADSFIQLRSICGTYVFDAVMAVLLGGTGSAKPIHKQYLSFFSSGDVTPWKANAGLKSNTMKNSNYQQRGFFNFPMIDNKRIKREFPEDMTLDEVCGIVECYPRELFRQNAQNLRREPVSNFLHTLHRILEYTLNQGELPMRKPSVSAPVQDTEASAAMTLSPEEYELILKLRSEKA